MRKTLLTYVKPHVQEDPLAMILGIAYLGRVPREGEASRSSSCDERIVNDQDDARGDRAQRHHRLRRADAEHPPRDRLGEVRQGARQDHRHGRPARVGRPGHLPRQRALRLRAQGRGRGDAAAVPARRSTATTTTALCARSRASPAMREGDDLGRQPGAAADQEARRAAAARAAPAADGALLPAQPRAARLHLHDARLPLQVHLLPEGAHRPRLPRALDAR